ncbi:MAG TPA: hypothetical protein VNH53_00800 [Sphingomicrobium sp.]|jgi:hypothetical protein|nr:hypothetical protein [Sphingomicrobium sp.]
MSETLTSSFAGQEVNAPVEFREFFQKYSQSTGASTVSELDRKPFPRMVDFWFLAICVAVRKGLKPVDLEGQDTYKAIEGAAIVSPEWRTQALRLIAIAETKDPEVVKDPRQMMRIANGLAFAGMPHLIEILEQYPDEEALCLADELVTIAG